MSGLDVAGLFSGIGGLELGLKRAGLSLTSMCEVDEAARQVLARRFEKIPVSGDIRDLKRLPNADVIAAGFPCQDLSSAGKTRGLGGSNSSLVGEIFRLLDSARGSGPTWLLLENVPFMLQLKGGKAMRQIIKAVEERGYAWAYRVVDARAFGLPQRRRRVIFLASKVADPKGVLFADDDGEVLSVACSDRPAFGFYWSEGTRGLGWTVNGVPTLKGGSKLGILTPPAIWFPEEQLIEVPDVRDAERLQGFPSGWTAPIVNPEGRSRVAARWRIVGNAVPVTMSTWVGRCLIREPRFDRDDRLSKLGPRERLPRAAAGAKGVAQRVEISEFPVLRQYRPLGEFLRYPTRPLSTRATAGFLARAKASTLRFVEGFLEDVGGHLDRQRDLART